MLESTLQNLGYTYRGGPRIDYSKCTGCGKCYEICPTDIFVFDQISRLIKVMYPEECWYCGACIYDCPAKGAIELDLPMACL
jgi:adenylylsulfate reductase subunit B